MLCLAGRSRLHWPLDAELLHAEAERARVEAELLGGVARAVDPPVALLEHGLDVRALDRGERSIGRPAGRACRLPARRSHRSRARRPSSGSSRARRRSAVRARCRASRSAGGRPWSARGTRSIRRPIRRWWRATKNHTSSRDVLAAIAQRRQHDRETRSAGSRGRSGSCPSRTAASRSRLVAAITRTSTRLVRDDPTRSNSPSCSTRSSRLWRSSGRSPTSSRKSVPPSAISNRPWRWADRPRERALLVAEQLALDQAGRQRGAVDADERALAPRAAFVDGVREQFLARARFAEQQHRAVGGRHLLHPLERQPQDVAVADDLVEVMAVLDFLVQVDVLGLQLAGSAARSPRGSRAGPVRGGVAAGPPR